MTKYQVMPPLAPLELADLYADIETHGVRVPVDVDEDGNILDGHHRAEIAISIGIGYPVRILDGLTEEQKIAHAFAVNVHRRSLTRDQKRALVAASLVREPELSDRQHAERTGTSPTTVGDVRGELEDAGQVSKLDTSTGADGKSYPKPAPRPRSIVESVEELHAAARPPLAVVDTETGEILDGPTLAGRAAADAVMDVIEAGPGYRQAILMRDVNRAMNIHPPFEIDPVEASGLPFSDGDIRAWERGCKDITDWLDSFLRARTGLRVINGGGHA